MKQDWPDKRSLISALTGRRITSGWFLTRNGAGRKSNFTELTLSLKITKRKKQLSLMAAKCECGQNWNPRMGSEARAGTILLVTKVYLRVPSNRQFREAGTTNTAIYARAILMPANSDTAIRETTGYVRTAFNDTLCRMTSRSWTNSSRSLTATRSSRVTREVDPEPSRPIT